MAPQGEVAATCAAFDQEFAKHLTHLLARKKALAADSIKAGTTKTGKNDDAVQKDRISVWQQQEKLGELMAHYFKRLPPHEGVPRLIEKALELQRKGEHRHASSKGFNVIKQLGLLDPAKSFANMKEVERRELDVQARFGCATCEAHLLLADDAALRHPHTLGAMLACLRQLREAVQLALPDEALYWLVHNGTVHIFRLTAPLLTAGYAAEVVEFLLFAVMAMESVLLLCAPTYLPWRTQLTATVTQCYIDLKVPEEAAKFVRRQLRLLKDQLQLETLEPIPLDPAIATVYQQTENRLNVLLFRATAEGAASEAALLESLAALEAPYDRVRALLEALRDPTRRTVRHGALPERLTALMGALDATATPIMGVFEAAESAAAALAEKAAADAERERAASADELDPQVEEAATSDPTAKPNTPPPAPAKKGAPPEPEVQSEPAELRDMTQDVQDACRALPMELHSLILTAAYNYECHELLAKTVAAAKSRLRSACDVDSAAHLELMRALVDIVEALARVEAQADAQHLRQLAQALSAQSAAVLQSIPDVLTDAALLLWGLTKSMMDSLYAPRPDPFQLEEEEQELLIFLLNRLHDVLGNLDMDDCMLRALVAHRLLLLLEETGRLREAQVVGREALATVHAFRQHFAERPRGAVDEARRWVQAHKPLDDVDVGLSETEMAYACIHADLYTLTCRVELALGVDEQQAAAGRRKGRAIATLEKRDQQVMIFGTKTPGEAKALESAIEAADKTPPNPVVAERILMGRANKNPYERALLLMQMAVFYPAHDRREQLLNEAGALLAHATATEAALHVTTSAYTTANAATGKLPPPPHVLMRTSSTLTVTAAPWKPPPKRGALPPVAFAVYAKPFGSGVGASLNSTTYEGSGVAAPLGSRVVLKGLAANETYIVCVAMLNANGEVVNGLGLPTAEIPALFTLPLTLCWGYLGASALRLGCPAVARAAFAHVLNHFTVRPTPQPLWTMNPFDSLALNMTHVVAAPLPVLRTLVFTLWGSAELASSAIQPVPHPTKAYIESQVMRLKMAKRLALAMEVAVYLQDEALLNESAMRLYNAVAPLLTGNTRSRRLTKVLATAHAALAHLTRLRDQRTISATASITYELVGLYRLVNEAPAAAHFSKLDLPLLLKPESPSAEEGTEGEDKLPPAPPQWNDDVLRLQEYLMGFPECAQFGSAALDARMADDSDLSAAVGRALLSEGVDAAYARVQTKEIFTPPVVEVKELVLGGADAKAKAGKPADGNSGRAAQVVECTPLGAGFESHLRELVRICQEALKKGQAEATKERVATALAAIAARSTCMPLEMGSNPPPPTYEDEAAAAAAAEADVQRWVSEELRGSLSGEEARERAAEARLRDNAARTLQRGLKALVGWRKHRLETRRVRQACFVYRAQLLEIRALVAFEEERTALANGRTLLGDAAVVAATGEATITEDAAVDPASPLPLPPAVEPVATLARAMTLCARGGGGGTSGCWAQLVNLAKLLWNMSRFLLQRYPQLGCYLGDALATAAQSINAAVARFRNEGLWLGPLRLPHGATQIGPGEQIYEPAIYQRPASRDSTVSFGSDLQVDSWFTQFTWIDMDWVHKLMQLAMMVLGVSGKPAAALREGALFNDLTDARFAESLAPLLLTASRRAGLEVARFEALKEQTLRDLTTFMEALMLARQVWKRQQKKALVVDKDGAAVSVGTLGSKKGSHKPASTHRSASPTKQRGGAVPSQEEHRAMLLAQTVAAYGKAIEVLTYRGEKDLLSQAQNELGDVYAFFGEWDKALVTWNDCVDGLTGVYKCIRSCAQFCQPAAPDTLQAFGLNKCLMAGVVFAKLSKFGYPQHLCTRLHAALASAAFLSAIFCCSLTHPQRQVDFAEYVPIEVWEGVNIFQDPFQCNVTDLWESVWYVTSLLVAHGRVLAALPLCSLLEYCAAHALRDTPKAIAARLLRAQALVELGNFAAAQRVLVDVMQGRRLPGLNSANTRAALTPDDAIPVMDVPSFRQCEAPGTEANQAAVSYLTTTTLPERLASLYGSENRMQLQLCVARLLVCLASVPNGWVYTDPHTRERRSEKSTLGSFEGQCLATARQILDGVLVTVDPPPLEDTGADASSPPPLPAPDAATVTVVVSARLLLARVERASWQYTAALKHTAAVMLLLGDGGAVVASRVAADGGEAGLGGAWAMGSLLWLQARVAQVELLLDAGHLRLLDAVYAMAVTEVAAVGDTWHAARLHVVKCMADADAGHTEAAMGGATALLEQLDTSCGGTAANAVGVERATVLVLLAELHQRCSLYGEADRFLLAARTTLETVVDAHGLVEMLADDKQRSLYMPGLLPLVKVLVLSAEMRLSFHQPAEAYTLLQRALLLVGYTRAGAPLYGRLLVALGRALRLQSREYLTTQPLREDGAQADAATVDPAVALAQCLAVVTLDGAHDWNLLHEALLERTWLTMANVDDDNQDVRASAVASAAATLAEAAAVAAQRTVLLQAPHTITTGVTDAALGTMPAWLRDMLRGREEFQVMIRGEAPGGALPQARPLVELFKALAQRQQRRILHADVMQAQAAAVHALLQSTCPEYVRQCCFSVVPGQPAAPVAPAEGLVLLQWQEREQPLAMEDSSAAERRRLAHAANPTLALPRAPFMAHALVVVQAPNVAPVCGVREMPLAAVRAAQTAVKELLVALVEPAVGDKTRFAPPPAAAVATVVDAAGRLFGDKRAAVIEAEGEVEEEQTPTFSMDFLTKLETLLNTSDGLHVTDATLATWLAQYL